MYEAYIQSLPPTTPGVRPGFVRRTVGYGDSRCPNEGCADRVMRVRSLYATFYGIDECYPVKHYAKVCQGGCGSTYYLNKKKRRGHDGSAWHTFYAWEHGIPDEITNKSGKSVMSAAFLTQVALTMSRMRYVYTGNRLPVCVDLFATYTVLSHGRPPTHLNPSRLLASSTVHWANCTQFAHDTYLDKLMNTSCPELLPDMYVCSPCCASTFK